MLLILSVRHTGNHTLWRILGGDWARAHTEAHRAHLNHTRHTDHIYVHFMPGVEEGIERVLPYVDGIIVPLRDPRAVVLSFHQRGESDPIADWQVMSDYLRNRNDFVFFPMEWMPYGSLEGHLGRPVERIDKVYGAVKPYREAELYRDGQHEALRHVPGYAEAERLLETDWIARRFYGAGGAVPEDCAGSQRAGIASGI